MMGWNYSSIPNFNGDLVETTDEVMAGMSYYIT